MEDNDETQARPLFEEEARERMKAGVNQHTSPKEKIPEGSKGQALDMAAKAVGEVTVAFSAKVPSVTFTAKA